jgi:hypothetical protein
MGTEYTHNDYKYLKKSEIKNFKQLPSPKDRIIGMKSLYQNIIENGKVIGRHIEMWYDEDPIKPDGSFRNQYTLAYSHDYIGDKAPTWSGPYQTYRVDMAKKTALVHMNARSIKAIQKS